MAVKNFKTGVIITGDSKGGVKAVKLTDDQLTKLNKTQRKTSKDARQAASDVGILSRSVGGLKSAAAAAAGVLAGVGVGAVGIGALRQAKEADALARAVGVGTNTLIQWQAAAQTVNVDAAKMGDIFKDLAEKIGDFAATGGGEAADVFALLNLNVEEMARLSPDEQLLKIAAGLDKVQTQGEKIFILESLASDAALLLPLLENNAAGLQELTGELDQLGVTLDAVELQSMREASLELDRLSQAGQGLANEIGQALAPILTEIGPTIREWSASLADTIGELGDNIRNGGLQVFSEYAAYARQGFTEMIGYADRAFLHIQEWWALLTLDGARAWLDLTQSAGTAWSAIEIGAGQAVDFILQSFAGMVSSLEGVGGLVDLLPGVEGAEAAIGDLSLGLGELASNEEQARQSAEAGNKIYLEKVAILEAARGEVVAGYEAQREGSRLAVQSGRLDLDLAFEQSAAIRETAKEKGLSALASEAMGEADKEAAKLGGLLTESLKDQEAATKDAIKAQADYQKSLGTLIDRLDPAAAKTREYMREVALLDEAWARGDLSGEELERLMFNLASGQEKQIAVTKTSTDQADPFADAWVGAIERVDDAFASAWTGAFDSFENFTDDLLQGFKRTLGEMAHAALTRPILVSLGLGGLGASGAASASSGGGLLSSAAGLLGNPLVSIGEALVGGGATGLGSGLISGAGALSQGLGTYASSVPGIFSAGGLSAGIGSLLPVLGIAGLAATVFGAFKKEPDPRFNVGGPIGGIGITGSQDLNSEQEEVVAGLVQQIDAFEDAFLGMLSEAQRQAIAEAGGSAARKIHVESEHELSSAIIQRMKNSLFVIDENLGGAMHDAIQEIRADRPHDLNLSDVDALVQEVLAPYLVVQEVMARIGVDLGGGLNAASQRIVSAAGSLEEYQRGVATYFEAFYSQAEQFDEFQRALTSSFSELGLEAIPATRAEFRALVEGIDLTTASGQALHGALAALVPELAGFYDATERLADQLSGIMAGIDDELASQNLTDFQSALRDVSVWLDETTKQAIEYGASQEDLAKIQQVAALRTREAIAGLQSEISSLVDALYGQAAGSGLSSIDQQITIERQRIQERQSAADELYRTELERFRASQEASERIDTYLAGLAVGNLSVLTPSQQLGAAGSNYQDLLARAQSGDSYALGQITQGADAYLRSGRDYYASSQPYTDIFNSVNADLEALALSLGAITEPGAPGSSSTSSLLEALEARRIAIERQGKQEDRQALALELVRGLSDMGVALDVSVIDLAIQNGIDLRALASDVGLNLKVLDRTLGLQLIDAANITGEHIQVVSDVLGVDLGRLAQNLGVDLSRLSGDISQDIGYLARTIGVDEEYLARAFGLSSDRLLNGLGAGLDALRSVVASLPPAQQAQLAPYLTSLEQATIETGQNTVAAIHQSLLAGGGEALQLLRAINGNAREQVNLLWGVRQNLRSIAGGLGATAYAMGSASVPRTGLYQVEQGEKIIDSTSSRILDRYGIAVNAGDTGAGSQALADQVQALRQEVQALRREMAERGEKAQTLGQAQIKAIEVNGTTQARAINRQSEGRLAGVRK